MATFLSKSFLHRKLMELDGSSHSDSEDSGSNKIELADIFAEQKHFGYSQEEVSESCNFEPFHNLY